MASQKHQLHFVLVPLMSPGHFIPMIDMAKLLAQRGVTTTVITTPHVASRFSSIVNRWVESGLPIRLLQIRFPSAESGLPEGCESLDTVPLALAKNLFLAIPLLQQPFDQLFKDLNPHPSCLIADKYLPWLADTAQKFQVPRIVFDGMSCFTLLCSHNLHISKVHESVSESSEPFLVPGFPDRVEFTKAQLPGEFNSASQQARDFGKATRAASERAYGVVINSFEELEPRYIEQYRKVKGDKTWCIGPVSLCNKENLDKGQRGNKSSINESECLNWLDGKEKGSVVYACLGSISRVGPPQLMELGLGLEASERPFVWVIRGGEKAEELEALMEEDGFEERTKGRGLVIRGWAPQVLILSHPAVGAFLTHCGWNSTLEGVCAGLPMVTWPLFAEQFFNEKLVGEVLEIGVSVGVRVCVNPWSEVDKLYQVLVKKEAVTEAVEKVMNDGIEGEERRERARVLGQMANRAVEEGGSSYLNVTFLIQDVMQLQVSQRSSA